MITIDSIEYQRYMRNEIARVERFIVLYPSNKFLPVLRTYLLNELLKTQLKYFDRVNNK
jgi:hypothetical protein